MTTPREEGNGGWQQADLVPRPDPTKLTNEAIDRVTLAYRRELIQLHDTLNIRLDAMDAARQQYLTEIDGKVAQLANFRTEQTAALRDVIETRLGAMDKATELLAAQVSAFPTETDKATSALHALLSVQITGSIDATERLEHRVELDLADLRTEYQTALHAAEVNRKEALAAAALTIQNGLDKAERQLQIALDKAERQLQVGLEAAEKRVNEKLDLANEKIEAGLIALRHSLTQEVANVDNVTTQRFQGVEDTFSANALALSAALAAQKEAAAEQNKSNTLAISKSEAATKETIAANAAQTTNSLASQAATIADLKERLVRLESGGVATREARIEQRETRGEGRADQAGVSQTVIMIIMSISVVIAIVSLIAFALKK